MRRSIAAAAAASLTLTVLSTTSTAQAEPRSSVEPSRQAAKTALAQARSLFDGDPRTGQRDATMVLHQLRRSMSELGAADRRTAQSLLARPTDPTGGAVNDRYTVPEEPPACGPTVCIHYVASTDDAPDMTDDDSSGVPDSVETALETAEQVNNTFVEAGYRRPKGDGALGGGSDLVDVYLVDIGAEGLYGYCTSDEPNAGPDGPYDAWAYCGIDNDFSSAEFPTNTPLENQQVTLAHEYYHAVQYAYDSYEDPWIMEATAAWAEDELYDGVNDNRQYLRSGQLRDPYTPLDTWESFGSVHYGNWLFFRYLGERYGATTGTMPNIVLKMWQRMDGSAGGPDQYSSQAVATTLRQDYGQQWAEVYSRFADANRRPGRAYEEGGAYGTAKPAQSFTLTKARRSTGWKSRRTRHMTSFTVRVRPGAGLRAGWRLRSWVDLGSKPTESAARMTTYFRGGSSRAPGGAVTSRQVPITTTGKGSYVTLFGNSRVEYVELTITNGSRRSNCWTNSSGPVLYSCLGNPRDDGLVQRYKLGVLTRGQGGSS